MTISNQQRADILHAAMSFAEAEAGRANEHARRKAEQQASEQVTPFDLAVAFFAHLGYRDWRARIMARKALEGAPREVRDLPGCLPSPNASV